LHASDSIQFGLPSGDKPLPHRALGWGERGARDTAPGSSLVQCERDRLSAANWVKSDKDREAVCNTVFAFTQTRIAFDYKLIVFKCIHVRQARKVCGNLATYSICDSRVLWLEYSPACRFANGAYDLQAETSNRQDCETAMRLTAASHRH
jgi:hypothetical protein